MTSISVNPVARRTLGTVALAVAASALALAAFPSAADTAPGPGNKKQPLKLGLADPVFSQDAATRAFWLDRAAQGDVDTIRLLANWRSIAGNQPPADPTNPSDPSYDWDRLDAAIRDAAARGFEVLITINVAPNFAEGPDRPPGAPVGSWRPQPHRLAEFSQAIATRYSGSFPDPINPGAVLPHVALWQIWAEPNGAIFISPLAEGPTHLRLMVNAAYAAIKAVNPLNEVFAGPTAPFGNDLITPPYRFWREFFCLSGPKLRRAESCPGGIAHIDGFGNNPLGHFAGLGPKAKAKNPGDILIPEMEKLRELLEAARKRRTVEPRGGTEIWAAELLWETNPPDPSGVSLDTQARHVTQALRLLRKQGVSRVIWVRIADEAPDPDFASTLQSGLFFNDGTPKPAFQAFHSP
jgi:hypothetical protein